MLSQHEIDALLGAASTDVAPVAAAFDLDDAPASLSAVGRAVKTYDFRRPDKFSKDQLRTLQAIHENVARITAARWGTRLRTNVSVGLADTAQMIYDEYVAGLTLPTQLVVLSAPALAGPILMDLDMGLALAAVDRLLGGPGQVPAVRREPTMIESGLVRRLIDDVIGAISEGWAHLERFDFEVTETAFSPALLRVAAPSHVVASLTYEVRIAGQTAPLTLCYPHPSLEPIVPRLAATAWYSQGDHAGAGDRSGMTAALQRVGIPVTGILGNVEVSMETLMDLQPGDVIRFDQRADQPVQVSIMDQVSAWAMPGRVGDRFALRVVSPLTPLEA